MVVDIDGLHLSVKDIVRVSRQRTRVRLTGGALERMREAHASVEATARRRPVYGFSTGVGANRSVNLGAGADHGLNLLRSHAVDAGQVLGRETVRAMMVIRLSQLAAAGSGINPDIPVALVGDAQRRCASRGARIRWHRHGGPAGVGRTGPDAAGGAPDHGRDDLFRPVGIVGHPGRDCPSSVRTR